MILEQNSLSVYFFLLLLNFCLVFLHEHILIYMKVTFIVKDYLDVQLLKDKENKFADKIQDNFLFL